MRTDLRFKLAKRLWQLAARVEPAVYALGERLTPTAEVLAPHAFAERRELVLNEGDRVLVALARDNQPLDGLHDMTNQLRDRFPGVEFTIVAGVQALAVQRSEETP